MIVPSVITDTSSDTGALWLLVTGAVVLSAIFLSSWVAFVIFETVSFLSGSGTDAGTGTAALSVGALAFLAAISAALLAAATFSASCFVTCSNRPSSLESSVSTSTSPSNVLTSTSSSFVLVSRLSSAGISSLTACEKSSLKSLKNPMFIPPFILSYSTVSAFTY